MSGHPASDHPNRPAVLHDVSTTQLDELERQYTQDDRAAWDALTGSYGWTNDDAEAVWIWFGERPEVTDRTE